MPQLSFLAKKAKSRARSEEKGVALVTTLLLLLLLTAMSVGMGLSVNSDMLMNGYYRNFRGAFYAADSGLAIARQDMLNQLEGAVPTTVTLTSSWQPIATGTEATIDSNITTNYASNLSITGSGTGQAASSWPEKFKLSSVTLSAPTCSITVTGGTGVQTCTSHNGTPTQFQYTYPYTLTSVGQSSGLESTTVTDTGNLLITVGITPGGTSTSSFAAWGMFIDQNDICSGSYLVGGTLTGPVFTNGSWTFGNGTSYNFTDSVGSAGSKFGYQPSSGSCSQSTPTCPTGGGACTYQGGYSIASQQQPLLSQHSVPLPNNDFSQKRAVLDSVGTNTNAITNTDLNAILRNVSQAKYPTTGASSGVYLPYTVDAMGNKTFSGGGIYVQGDASVTLTPSGTTAQIYTITQGTTTTTITVNPTTNVTTMVSGSTTLTISGVPVQRDPSTNAVIEDATMLYVNGNITSLSGPVSSNGATATAAIQDGQAINITAAGDMTVTGDLKYKTNPISTPADTVITANDSGQTLGLFTATGDIKLDNAQSSNNLEIDASLATISTGGSGGLTNTGDAINTLTIIGGRIQNQIKNINATTRNVYFDRRYSQNGFAPPWFPSTTVTQTGTYVPAITGNSFQRTQWVNQTSYY